MKKNHFRLGLFILGGLASYFLLLSAALVASAGMTGSGSNAGKASQFRKPLQAKHAANFSFNDKWADRRPGSKAIHPTNPCLSSTAVCNSALDQGEGELAAESWRRLGDSVIAKSGSFGDHNFPSPTSYGFNAFGADGATFGQFIGESGASSQGSEDAGTFGKTETPFDFIESDPKITSISGDPATTPFILTDVPLSGDPGSPISFIPSDPPPSSHPGTLLIPEPSTFWLFVTSLTALAVMLGAIKKARKMPAGHREHFG